MLYDVVVTRGVVDSIFRNGISKSDAKKLIKNLRKQGWKAQLVTSKGKTAEANFEIQEIEEGDDE